MGTVLAYAPALVLEAAFTAHRFKDPFGPARGAICGGVKNGEVFADDLASFVSFDPPCPGVPGRDVAARIEHENRVVGDGVDQRVKRVLRLLESLIDALSSHFVPPSGVLHASALLTLRRHRPFARQGSVAHSDSSLYPRQWRVPSRPFAGGPVREGRTGRARHDSRRATAG